MIKLGNYKDSNKDNYMVSAVFMGKEPNNKIIKKEMEITEFADSKKIYIYLGSSEKYTLCKLKKAIRKIISLNRKKIAIISTSFVNKEISLSDVVKYFTEMQIYFNSNIWNMKTGKNVPKKPSEITLLDSNNQKDVFQKAMLLAECRNFARSLQIQPPNILNSVVLADEIKNYLKSEKNLSIKVLTKKEIVENKMGLLLSVNAASQYEPRVVVVEYKGNPKSKEKQAFIGKGICFDSGGMNLKIKNFILSMKYDMSATAIIAGAMKAIAHGKPKKNIVAVLCLTDNAIGNTATYPESVVKSMNGMSVEINNTDAEGRLALADGITYAIRKCNATRILDMATLTGAIISALGETFTGAWATSDNEWNKLKMAAKNADELVWRMPFHNDYLRYMKKSLVADLKNTDYTGKGGSNSAAMFLKEFTEGLPFIHLDIAGTAFFDEKPKGVMVKTIYEFAMLTTK